PGGLLRSFALLVIVIVVSPSASSPYVGPAWCGSFTTKGTAGRPVQCPRVSPPRCVCTACHASVATRSWHRRDATWRNLASTRGPGPAKTVTDDTHDKRHLRTTDSRTPDRPRRATRCRRSRRPPTYWKERQ